jgi:hypothetical protein
MATQHTSSFAMSDDVTSRISDFISRERDRFQYDVNNMLAFGAGHIIRYREFLEIIHARQMQASERLIGNEMAWNETMKEGANTLTRENMQLYRQSIPLTAELHLEIESFYLFAKILLDKVARFLEFYFGPQQRHSLDSHDGLAKCIDSYAECKGLHVPTDLRALICDCKKRISDFRDYQISHEKSPRTIHGTSFTLDGGRTLMHLHKFSPKANDAGVSSEPVPELIALVDRYLHAVVSFVATNCEKSHLKLLDQPMEKS